MTPEETIQAAAQWMLLELEANGQVSLAYATEHLATRFAEPVVHGGSAIDDKVIDAFQKLALEKTGGAAAYEGETWFLRRGNSPLI
jgi:hypothetical protein